MVLFTVVLSVNAFAMTNAERDLYNHQYYPQSVNNGGINQAPQENKHDFYVSPASGNSTVRVTDVVLPGKNGFDLEISRVYNSFSSNLYEPYVIEEEAYTSTPFYMVVGKKDFEKTNTYNEMTDFGYNNPICINANYYDYTTGTQKYSNMSEFEFDDELYTEDDVFADYDEALALAEELNDTNPDISATYPNASVGYYWADYKDFTVETVYINVYDPIFGTGLLPDTSNERYSKLGAGWEFDFPYVEKRYGEDWYEYLHYGDKGVWEIDTSSDGGENGLLGYTLNDIILEYDTSVTHDGYDSEYCVTEKDGKKSYFGEDGRLLLQRDRYGNEIKFYCDWEYYYDTYGDRHKYPYLIGITDSVGRTVTINYGSDYTSSSTTYKDITLTITDPTNSSNTLVYTYRLQQLANKSLDDDIQEYVLNKVTRPDGEYSRYSYWYLEAPVNFFDRNTTFAYEYADYKNSNTGNSYITSDDVAEISGASNYYALLSTANEPDDRECRFYYSRFLKNCTPTGSMLFFKAYYMCDDVRFDENDTQYEVNEHNYQYFINNDYEYDGYPGYRRTERIPSTFRIIAKDIVGDKNSSADKLVTNTYTYRYTGIEDTQTILLDNSVSSSVDFKTTVNYTYNEDTSLVTNTLTKNYDSASATDYMQYNEAYTYDSGDYGDLLSVTPNSDSDRTISYEYNSSYHYPTKRTYKRNASATVVEEYTPTSDNLSVQYEKVYENDTLKKTIEYVHDSYGNITQKKEFLNDTDYIRTDYSYTDTQYNGQFTGSNLMSETVYGVSDNDNSSKNISVSYQYDWRGNPTKVTDANGNSTLYEYDELNRVIKTTAPDGSVETTSYDYGDTEITKTDALGTDFIYYYDGSGNLLEEAIDTWQNQIKEYWYDGYNNLIKEITRSSDNNESTTTYTYDTLQRPLTKEVYDNSGTLVYKETYSYEVTADYRKETATVVGGENNPSVVTSVYYDNYGNKIKTEVGSDYETYTSDYAGNITSVKSVRANSEGWTESYLTEYDFMGNIVKETDELGNVTRAEYDQLGRIVKAYDENSYATEYKYDNLGRVIEQKTPFEEKDGTIYYSTKQMWYDNNGNIVKERVYTNAAGETSKYNEVKYTYDILNRLVMTESNDGTNSNYVQNYYDAKGNLLRVYTGLHAPLTINGLDDVTTGSDTEYAVAKYSYDSLGRLLTTTDALGNVESNTYDTANGLLLSSTDRNGNTFNFTYDGSGKVKSKALADGTNAETTVYGLTGQPLSKQNGTATISYVYNDKGLIASETNSASGVVKAFTYDSAGNVLTMTVTRNGVVDMSQNYVYDKLNRLTSVSENGTVIATYSYDNKNNRTQTIVPGGETTSYNYNIANMLTSQTIGDKISEAYSYYLNGNQKSKVSNGQTTNYTYDSMNRLISENDTQYSFDDFGNRLTMSDGGVTTTYSYDLNNRLTESVEENGDVTTSIKFFYDNNGNQITKATMVNQAYTEGMSGDYTISNVSDNFVALYEYNCYNQLVEVDTDGVVSSYAYTPDGLRHSKTVGVETTTFVYDNANVIEEITSSGENKYYRGIEIIKNDEGLYYLYNGQGDVSILADSSGATVANYEFDAYGNQSEENTIYNPFGYCGEYTDTESGLIYLRARMYDAQTGRFINEDPARSGTNWYVYAENNPILFIDPSGLDAVLITADDAAMWQGHTSILTQDTRDGNWYYFYWGDKAVYFVEVPWEDGAMSSLDSFNNWLDNQNLPYSTKNYTSATFVEGDFNASVDYFKNLVSNTTIESGYKMEAGRYDKPTLEYYQINKSYDLWNANCLQMSMKGFNKGKLKDGTSVSSFMSGQLEKTTLATIRPNTAEGVFNQLFFNRRFTRSAAKNDLTWEALYGSPSDKYKAKGLYYARTLGVSK